MTSCLVIRFVGRLCEDLLELVGALGRVVRAAGRLGDRLERLLVDRAPEAAAAATVRRRRRSRRRHRSPAARVGLGRLAADERRPAPRALRARDPRSRTRSCRRARPRAAACWAASTGSGPALLAPSVSRTMIAGAYAPSGPAAGPRPAERPRPGSARRSGRSRRSRRSTRGSRCRSPSGARSSGSATTSSRTSWSVVGAWTISAKPANATMPIWVVEPWRSMNDGGGRFGRDAAGWAGCRSRTCCATRPSPG